MSIRFSSTMFASLCLGAIGAAQQSAFYNPPAGLKESATSQGASFGSIEAQTGISLNVTIDPYQKRIELLWDNTAALEVHAHKQMVPVGYVPTEVVRGAQYGEIYVGGTNKFGYTKITRYLFEEPSIGTDLNPVDANLLETDEVFGAPNSSSTRDVYQLIANRSSSSHLFVQFWNTKDVHDLDLVTGVITRVASSTSPAPNCIILTELANRHDLVYSRDHMDNGYVYFFCAIDPLDMTSSTVVMRDTDRDGTLNDGFVVSLATYQSMGLGNASRYIDQ